MAGPAVEHDKDALRPPPPLPRHLLALAPIVYTGVAIWAAASVALAIAHYGFGVTPPIWLWTTLSGMVLGLIGAGVIRWQSRAARRGSRAAQKVE